MLRRLLPLLLLVSALAVPASASANEQMLSLVQDDDLLVYRSDAVRDRALHQIKALGADGVRVTLLWEVVAENSRDTRAQKRRFARLGADDPRAYPRLNWDRYDRLARAARNLGLHVLFNVTGPGPSWAHTKPPRKYRRHARTWRPRPAAFYEFVRAVGKRFNGRFRDENDGRFPIPPVTMWSIWNEPNQGGWLTPQNVGGKAVSPALYRELWDHGHRALRRTGHGRDLILMGETAPTGVRRRTVTSAVAPKTFIRGVFCVDGAGRRRKGEGCDIFDKVGGFTPGGWAHHPYTKNISPLQVERDRNALTMANISELPALLDQIAANSKRLPERLPIASTEFGYESNPPDKRFGVPLATQALWNVLGDFVAVREPRMIANTQFLLRDVAPNRRHKKDSRNYWLTYQSGLYGRTGSVKPAATSWAFPFFGVPFGVTPGGGRTVFFWGMLRFRPNEPGDRVALQWRATDSSPSDWQTIGEPVTTTAIGVFEETREVPGAGYVRAVWIGDGPAPIALPLPIP